MMLDSLLEEGERDIYNTPEITHNCKGILKGNHCLKCFTYPGDWVGNIPWRREWQPTPGFLPGEFHKQRRLAGYSPWDHKESETAERLTHTDIHYHNKSLQ